MKAPLDGYRVVDLSTVALGTAGALLADLGATVVAPGGSTDADELLDLVGGIDAVVLELPRDDGITSAALFAAFEGRGESPLVVECSFYGRSDNEQAPLDEFLLQAASAIMAHTGDPERGACRLGGRFATTLVAVETAATVVVGLRAGRRGIVRLNAVAALAPCSFHRRMAAATGHRELGFFGSGIRRNGRRLRLVYQTQDGQVVCPYHPKNMLPRTRGWLADAGVAAESIAAMDSIITASVFNSDQDEIATMESGLTELFAALTTDHAVEEGQRRGLPIEAVQTPEQVASDPHLKAQGIVDITEDAEVEIGVPYLLTTNVQTASAAPRRASDPATCRDLRMPLKGIRVVAFTTMLAGPILGRRLADLGAEVWRVESASAEDFTRVSVPFVTLEDGERVSAVFSNVNAGVKSVQLDMAAEGDRTIADRLIAEADILVENMRPGLLEKWGLDTGRLWQVNPDLVVVRLSGMGQTGPRARHRVVGQSMTAVSGQLEMTGWPDRPPVLTDVPAGDFLAPVFGLLTTVAALRARELNATGYEIDYSESAGLVYTLQKEVDAAASGGALVNRMGNQDPLRPDLRFALLPCDGALLAVVGTPASRDADDWELELRTLVQDASAGEATTLLNERGVHVAPFVEPGDLVAQEPLVESGYYGRLLGVEGVEGLLDGPPTDSFGPLPREYRVSRLGADTQAILESLALDGLDAGVTEQVAR